MLGKEDGTEFFNIVFKLGGELNKGFSGEFFEILREESLGKEFVVGEIEHNSDKFGINFISFSFSDVKFHEVGHEEEIKNYPVEFKFFEGSFKTLFIYG